MEGILDDFQRAFSGAWCTDIHGNFTRAETANATSNAIKQRAKQRDVIDLRKVPTGTPGAEPFADICLWHMHRVLNGRIISQEQAGYLRASGGTIGVDDWDGRSYGKRMVPVYTKLHVRCMHLQNPGKIINCEVYGLYQKLPLHNIVETKIVGSINKAARMLNKRNDAEIALKKRKGTDPISGTVMASMADGISSVEAFLRGYYQIPGDRIDVEQMATMLASAMRSGILMHVSSNEGGDRFKDKRGVQALADEYDEAINRFITA
jgi:hypothetical protein